MNAKHCALIQNDACLLFPAFICGFVRSKQAFSIRNTSLYGNQPSLVVFSFKTASLAPELEVSMGPSPHLWFLHAKQRLLDQNYKSPWVPDLTSRFVLAKQRN